MRTLLRRRRRTAPTGRPLIDTDQLVAAEAPVNAMRAESDAWQSQVEWRDERIAELERQLAKAEVKAKYLTLGDLDRSLKWAGIENGLNGVHSLGLDGPRGDMGGALEVVIHRYTLDAYGARHWVAGDEEGAVLDSERPDGSKLPGGIAAETRRFLLRRDGGLDPR